MEWCYCGFSFSTHWETEELIETTKRYLIYVSHSDEEIFDVDIIMSAILPVMMFTSILI